MHQARTRQRILVLAVVLGLMVTVAACSGSSSKRGLVGLDTAGTTTTQSSSSDTSSSDTGNASGTGADEQAYVDAITRSIEASSSTDTTAPKGAQARCMARRWVKILRVDRLHQLGINPSDLAGLDDLSKLNLSHADGVEFVDAMTACGYDWKTLVWASAKSSSSLSQSDIDCLDQQIPTNQLRDVLADELISNGSATANAQFAQTLVSAAQTCGIDTSKLGE